MLLLGLLFILISEKYPYFLQLDFKDFGPTCLRMICKFHGKNYNADYLREIASLSGDGTTLGGLADASEKLGFSTLAEQIPLPCVAHWRQRYYVVVFEADKEKVVIGYPFEEFGAVYGEIASIAELPSKDEQFFWATASLPNGLVTDSNKKVNFKTGMKASAEIVTEDMRLIERLFFNFKRSLQQR